MIFGSSYREDRKKWGSRNQNSTEVILKHPDFNRRREMHDIKETVNCFSYEKFGEILNRHFAEPFKSALFRADTETRVLAAAHLGRPLHSSLSLLS